MKNLADPTGRFSTRPFYTESELDFECEGFVTKFLSGLHGKVSFPIQTDDLLKLIERDVEDLDVYADLSAEGVDVEGVTDFARGAKPRVRIARRLSETPALSNRYRTTLTHEYGHVRLHGYLFQADQAQGRLKKGVASGKNSCHRDGILEAPATDWMEWQAGYACGALLMPVTHVKRLAGDMLAQAVLGPPVAVATPEGARLLSAVTTTFEVSEDAARVRLTKLGLLTTRTLPGSLFGPRPAG